MNAQAKGHRIAFTAHSRALSEKDPGFAAFYLHTITATEEEDLTALDPQVEEDILRHSYARLGQRAPGTHLINIWTPETELPDRSQIIDIYVDDMPFLVDSVLAAIRAHGISIRLISHPVLPVDKKGTHWRVLGSQDTASSFESFLHIHIDPVADETVSSALFDEIDGVLTEVRRTVEDWRPMLERLHAVVNTYREHPPQVPEPVLTECLHFLAWIANHNFTFLGLREYRLTGEGEDARLDPVEGSGLGILRDPEFRFLRHGPDYVEMTAEHIAFLQHISPLIVTKANARARVHRRSHMDYIGAKLYDENGTLSGELRIVGLFTSMSLTIPNSQVPLVRSKLDKVMHRSGLDPKSHAGKALLTALEHYPRDELFQIPDDQLYEFATIIAGLPDRPRLRVLPRIDPFDNFVSVLVFLPRDCYTAEVRRQIGLYLAERYDGRVSVYSPHFPEGDLVRVHFIIGRNGGPTPQPDRAELETDIEDLTRTFGDRLMEFAEDPGAVAEYRTAFSLGYQSRHSHETALADIAVFRALDDESDIAARLHPGPSGSGTLTLKVYHKSSPIPLSDRVPLLENFGFSVIDERTDIVVPLDGSERYLHDMLLQPPEDISLVIDTMGPVLERALLAVWSSKAENDPFNQLTLKAGLEWDHVAVLRALGRYLRQIGTSFSQRYLATTLGNHPGAANALITLFHTRFDPDFNGERAAETERIAGDIEQTLAEIASIDEDRIIRQFRNLLLAGLRTNFFQRDEEGRRRPALAIKFDSRQIESMPAPQPYREIFVYAPRVEGVHLRFGPIARGGLRWSDRPQDFRTEVLGLVKAQQVKNAIIVPVGAKGGFVPKLMPTNPDRDTYLAEGSACYKLFVGALLDITDNLDRDRLVPPPQTVRPDGDDPYLVVAADKGTASFSDTANAIAISREYWLSDAFASGGSDGYDHKKMGITARGAWEAIKRHFREMNRDIQSEPFTAAGVGDMSGDVFGNGMLLSPEIRLIAAFDHRDIFIDPNPDPATSYAERQRLFNMGRSSWQDYNRELLSAGGGIYSRAQKSIPLAPEACQALGLDKDMLTPNELIRAILKAKVDLLWFGGIGTYVRAQDETDAEVDDRANDAVRITAPQMRASVVGEGANLGITQRGRIEFALNGGRINTDAIDNSAGVNSSDLEVNIKIALGTLVRNGTMTLEERNGLLEEMTEEVAGLCLHNNYLQTLAISLASHWGMAEFPDHIAFMQALEQNGELDRSLEFLPDNQAVQERTNSGKPLTRPELAVLLAYAKNTLYTDLLDSSVPDDPYLATELFRYFPATLKDRYAHAIVNHRLRREVIATVLANAMVNRGGPAFVHKMTTATSANSAQIARAYAAARDSYGTTGLNAAIDALDTRINGPTQLALYAEVETLLVSQTLWFLRNVSFADGLSGVIRRYSRGVKEVQARIAQLAPDFVVQSVHNQAQGFIAGGTPQDLAQRIAELSVLTLASDIVHVAEGCETSTIEAAEAYFELLSVFNLGRITEQAGHIALADRYDRMALDRALANVMHAQRGLTADVLRSGSGSVKDRFAAWRKAHAQEIDRSVTMVAELTDGELTVSRLSVAAGLLSDLAQL